MGLDMELMFQEYWGRLLGVVKAVLGKAGIVACVQASRHVAQLYVVSPLIGYSLTRRASQSEEKILSPTTISKLPLMVSPLILPL